MVIKMKYFYIPCAILALILALSLYNARAVDGYVTDWCETLSSAQEAADSGDWTAAQVRLSSVHEAWDAAQSYFHTVITHAELDEAEALFAKSDSFLHEHDEAEFRANTAELITQLRLLAEIQEISIKNIL